MYLVYLAVSLALTIWVGHTLSRNGKVFLEDAFANERLASSVNQLLVVGFYLLNLGYVSVAMRDSANVADAAGAMEELSLKLGYVLLVLGAVHFFNLYALSRYRRTRLRTASGVPPLPPTAVIAPRDPAQHAQMQAQAYAQFQARQATEAAAPASRSQPPTWAAPEGGESE
jgi:hypothetical protein